jgi:hypothetical protein
VIQNSIEFLFKTTNLIRIKRYLRKYFIHLEEEIISQEEYVYQKINYNPYHMTKDLQLLDC